MRNIVNSYVTKVENKGLPFAHEQILVYLLNTIHSNIYYKRVI